MRGELVQVLIEFWIMECESSQIWLGGHFQHFQLVGFNFNSLDLFSSFRSLRNFLLLPLHIVTLESSTSCSRQLGPF